MFHNSLIFQLDVQSPSWITVNRKSIIDRPPKPSKIDIDTEIIQKIEEHKWERQMQMFIFAKRLEKEIDLYVNTWRDVKRKMRM